MPVEKYTRVLINFHSPVDLPDKEPCSPCANSSAHEEQANAEQRHVPEVEAHLQ